MRVTVKVKDICLVIPCGDGKKLSKWLILEAIERSRTSGEPVVEPASEYCLCLPNNGGIISPADNICDVLENDGFVELKGQFLMCSLRPIFHFDRIVPKRINSVLLCFMSTRIELLIVTLRYV